MCYRSPTARASDINPSNELSTTLDPLAFTWNGPGDPRQTTAPSTNRTENTHDCWLAACHATSNIQRWMRSQESGKAAARLLAFWLACRRTRFTHLSRRGAPGNRDRLPRALSCAVSPSCTSARGCKFAKPLPRSSTWRLFYTPAFSSPQGLQPLMARHAVFRRASRHVQGDVVFCRRRHHIYH
jgi:hypothetical protein